MGCFRTQAVVVALCLFFSPAASFVSPALQRAARETAVKATAEEKAPGAAIAAAAVGAALIAAQPMAAGAITSEQRNQLSYEQVKGTGLANRCNDVVGTDSISIKAGGCVSRPRARQKRRRAPAPARRHPPPSPRARGAPLGRANPRP